MMRSPTSTPLSLDLDACAVWRLPGLGDSRDRPSSLLDLAPAKTAALKPSCDTFTVVDCEAVSEGHGSSGEPASACSHAASRLTRASPVLVRTGKASWL